MGMKKGQSQYGKALTERIMKIHYEQGRSIRDTAEELGLGVKVVTNAITREHHRQRNQEQGIMLNRKGRPRIKPMNTLEELQKRNKELEKFHEELRR